MKTITKEQLIRIHSRLIAETGGIDGVRDENLLDSALNAPFQIFGGVELYSDIRQKAARLGYGIIKNHPFLDGNKRIGAHSMLLFLALNDIRLCYSQNELVNVILSVADGSADVDTLIEWITSYS